MNVSRIAILGWILAGIIGCQGSGSSEENGDGDGTGTCTQVGCEDGLVVSFSSKLGPGNYHLEVTTENGVSTCSLEIFDGEGEESGWRDDCSGVDSMGISPDGFGVNGTPASVEATVRAPDSGQVTSATFTPTYEEWYPNGPNCNMCLEAEGEMPEFSEASDPMDM